MGRERARRTKKGRERGGKHRASLPWLLVKRFSQEIEQREWKVLSF